MKRRRLLYAGAAVGAASAGLAWQQWAEHRRASVPPWNLRFAAPGGGELRMSSLRGRALVLNFWATWCPPCVHEMPELDRFAREWAPRGWQVLGLAIDQAQPVAEFLRRQPVGYPIALAGIQGIDLSRQLGNLAGGLPFTALFDARGAVRRRKTGQTTLAELAAWAGAID